MEVVDGPEALRPGIVDPVNEWACVVWAARLVGRELLAQLKLTRREDHVFRPRDDALVQGTRRGRKLEGRSGRVLALDGVVEQRIARVVAQADRSSRPGSGRVMRLFSYVGYDTIARISPVCGFMAMTTPLEMRCCPVSP